MEKGLLWKVDVVEGGCCGRWMLWKVVVVDKWMLYGVVVGGLLLWEVVVAGWLL